MNPPAAASRARGATLAGLLAIVLWSSLATLTAASGATPPFQLAAITFLIGGLAGLCVAAARGRLDRLRAGPAAWALGVGGLFGYHAVYFTALRLAPPAEASLIAYLWPLLIVLFSALLPGETPRARHVLGAILGFGGAGILLLGRSGDIGGGDFRGYALALACAFIWSAYSVLSRRLDGAPTEAIAGYCLVTAALAGLCHVAFEQTLWPGAWREWAAILGLGLGPVGLAFYVWDHGVRRGDIQLLGVAAYAAPVLSLLLLIAAGHARATASLGVACALIAAGAAIASTARR